MSDENGTPANDPNQTPRRVGYARVSTDEQNLDLQLDALVAAGCDRESIYLDKVSGSKADRPGLDRCLKELEPGDTLIVWRLDRLGRSLSHLVSVVQDLAERQIGFRSTEEGVFDTTTATGELLFNLFAVLAQFERRLIQERTRAGLAAARARGRTGGRKAIEVDDPKVRTAKALHRDEEMSVAEICETLNISKTTLYRYLALDD